MTPAPGTRLGVYEVLAVLGTGGMGVVHRARDTRLNRDVAIKLLLPAVADDPERLARFEREASTLASLNHPNIGQIYGFDDGASTSGPFLVMELVEGPTLADRIASGPLPIEEALAVARQIVDALDAAHERGIVHRDLKPANVKMRPDGTVKVLDFGLAKTLEPAGASGLSSPAVTSPVMTRVGAIVGTPAYMSPEQATGRPADTRSDIWAFGCVVYEMLTGRRAFDAADASDTITAIIKGDVDWSHVPPSTPSRLRQAMSACLQRDPKLRIRDAADLRLLLAGAFEFTAPASQARLRIWQRPAAVAALAIVTAISVALAGWALRRGWTDLRPPVRLTVSVQSDNDLDAERFWAPSLALSPDGRVLVYAARRNGVLQLYRRPLDQFSPTPISGTDGGAMPFFSPDGQWIGFFAGGAMKKIPASGGEPITVTSSSVAAASWGADDGIVFSQSTFGSTLKRASAAGGDASPLTTLDASRGEAAHQAPEVLPGGRAVLFHVVPSGKILARSLPDGVPKELIEGVWPRYVPTGHLAFVRGTSLWVAPFNADRLEVTGPAVRLAEGILSPPAVAGDGTLAYVSGVPSRVQLVWVTRQGHEEAADLDAADFNDVALSPDGKRAVLSRGNYLTSVDVWIGDFARRTLIRLTTGGVNVFPLWTRDGRSVVYSSTLEGGRNIFRSAADGSGKPERLTRSANQQSPWTWSKDGRTLVLNELRPNTGYDLMTVPADGGAESVLIDGPRSDMNPAVSPDGRWIAYQSNESGTTQVVVRQFTNVADRRRWQVSTDGGAEPKWSADGRELFYRRGAAVMSVPIRDDPGAARPEKLFEGNYVRDGGQKSWDIARDGRFLMKKALRAEYSINVVLNWADELKSRVRKK